MSMDKSMNKRKGPPGCSSLPRPIKYNSGLAGILSDPSTRTRSISRHLLEDSRREKPSIETTNRKLNLYPYVVMYVMPILICSTTTVLSCQSVPRRARGRCPVWR